MTLAKAKEIFGKNFIGPDELNKISGILRIKNLEEKEIPKIKFEDSLLEKRSEDSMLVLGAASHFDGKSLNIKSLRNIFGIDPKQKEPCFYNQDWYINHRFIEESLNNEWYLIGKEVAPLSRGKDPEGFNQSEDKVFPKAILTAFTFFANYLLNNEILWKNDFIWCSDFDDNGDRIYTGGYVDLIGKNKNGFNIHRYLKIRSNYGIVFEIK